MSHIKLDLKMFQHHSSDKDSTTLKHMKAGHTITLAHKGLSKQARAQLEELAKASDEQFGNSEKMAEGGEVDEFGYPKTGRKDSPAQIDKYKGMKKGFMEGSKPKPPPTPEPKQYAKGGDVPDYLKPAEDDSVPQETDFVTQAMNPANIHIPTEAEQKAEYYNKELQKKVDTARALDAAGGGGFDPVEATPDQFFQDGKAPKSFSPEIGQKALQKYEFDKGEEQFQKGEDKLQDEKNSAIAQQFGINPSSQAPKPDLAIEDQSGIAPESTATAQSTQPKQPMSGVDMQMAGINKELLARQGLAKEQQGIQDQRTLDAQKAAETYKKNIDSLETERQAHIQDIQDGHIDPERYWTGNPKTGEGGHSKLLTGIGMILAGFNPTNSPNAAINFLKFQMEQNLEAQKQNLASHQNLLSANLRQFGNLKDAQDMTRIMQNDVVSHMLDSAAAKAVGGPNGLAAAAALKAKGELKAQSDALTSKLGANMAISQLEQAAKADPSKMDVLINGLEAAGDPRAKDYRSRAIPGIGFANTPEDAKELKDMHAGINTAKGGIKELLAISKQPFKSFSPELRAKTDTIRQTLVGALRLPITGPGAMNEGERELLQKIIANPTAIFSLDSVNNARLNTLAKTLDSKFVDAAKARGLSIPQSQEAEIKTGKDGKNYRKVPGGWVPVK